MTRSADIQALFQQGKRIDRPSLTVLWRRTGSARRAGFAVTRQIRGSVRRNRARRRLREAFRATRNAAPGDVVVVLIAKRRVLEMPFPELTAEVHGALMAIPGTRTTA